MHKPNVKPDWLWDFLGRRGLNLCIPVECNFQSEPTLTFVSTLG